MVLIKINKFYWNENPADLFDHFLVTHKLWFLFAIISIFPSAFNFLFGRVLGSGNEEKNAFCSCFHYFYLFGCYNSVSYHYDFCLTAFLVIFVFWSPCQTSFFQTETWLPWTYFIFWCIWILMWSIILGKKVYIYIYTQIWSEIKSYRRAVQMLF